MSEGVQEEVNLHSQSLWESRCQKLVMVLWILIPVVVLLALVYGWSIDDRQGALLLSFLPVSLLTVIATLIALMAETAVSKFSGPVWVAVSVAALFSAMVFANGPMPDAPKGADTILAYVMLILSIPVALLVPLLLTVIAPLWDGAGGLVGLCGMWAAFFIAGYLQWFVLLPWLRRKWKGVKRIRVKPV
jgi:hypothetical protein